MTGRESLDELIAKLPRDVEPPRNLWPHIVRGIIRPPRRTPWLAFVAAGAVICLSGGLAWVILGGRPAALRPAPIVAVVPAVAFDEPRDAQYVATRVALQRTFEERLALLDPETRAQIESSLAAIRKAREDIRKALAAQPDSPVLEQLLESAWHDEFDLYEEVVQTTQPTLAST
jgi:hypothetical protein